jgi:hypothetical protein
MLGAQAIRLTRLTKIKIQAGEGARIHCTFLKKDSKRKSTARPGAKRAGNTKAKDRVEENDEDLERVSLSDVSGSAEDSAPPSPIKRSNGKGKARPQPPRLRTASAPTLPLSPAQSLSKTSRKSVTHKISEPRISGAQADLGGMALVFDSDSGSDDPEANPHFSASARSKYENPLNLHDVDDGPEDGPNCGNVEYVEHAEEDSGPDEEVWSYSLCGGSVSNSSRSITAAGTTKRRAPRAVADSDNDDGDLNTPARKKLRTFGEGGTSTRGRSDSLPSVRAPRASHSLVETLDKANADWKSRPSTSVATGGADVIELSSD